MGKTRVHLLAKELGIETKDLIAQLDKLGIRGRKAQSSLEDDEVARARVALAVQERPQVHVGEEKVIADRVVKAEDDNLREVQARETIVERRIRANVIRRRTSRVEVPQAEKADLEAEVAKRPGQEPQPILEEPDLTPPAEEVPAHPMPEFDALEEAPLGGEAEGQETPTAAESREAEAPTTGRGSEAAAEPAGASVAPTKEGAPRGARILGRIDLKRTIRVEQAPIPVARRPAPGAPAVPSQGVEMPRPPRDLEGQKTEGAEESKPAKVGRHKKRVVKKQDVLEFREKELRAGRIPKKKRALPGKEQKKTEITVPKASKRVIRISEVITVGDLARDMGIKAGEVIKKLMSLGMMASINQVLDVDTATLVAADFDYQVENVAFDAESMLEAEQVEEESMLVSRPPVVTIMGHVDHGKTSLLDAIRSTNVTAQEHGGITQHIGAYHVQVDGRSVTFLDTPGHEAFTAMRARGAKVTDIVVLVVAADDGVMPQTIEAISHAKAAKVPLIVAINKIDKPDANPQWVRTELLSHEIVVESMGGDTLEFEVSAKTGDGLETLLEGLQLQAEILELKANPDRAAEGTVIEAKLDRGRGPVATVLVQRGTLRTGDIVVAGAEWGRVRALVNDQGDNVKEAGPSVPVEVLGFSGTPDAGDRLAVVDSEARAREVTAYRARQKREKTAARESGMRGSLEQMMSQLKT